MEQANGPGGPAEDALRRLERRLDQASQAAERVISEAASAADPGAFKVPPAGWQRREPAEVPQDRPELSGGHAPPPRQAFYGS